MRKSVFLFFLSLAAVSCGDLADGEAGRGAICVRFSSDNPNHSGSKSGLPDTNRFILSVSDASGHQIFNGPYGNAPERIIADPGSYTVSAVSEEFPAPCFDTPQYGDSQVVAVNAGQTVSVLLDCVQQNAGIRLNVTRAFVNEYPEGILYLKSSDGTLMYGYSEKRTAYFKPGAVTLSLSNGGVAKALFTRVLEPREMLVMNVSTGSNDESKAGIMVQVDTSRLWRSGSCVFDAEGDGESDTDNPLSVDEARQSAPLNDVWVCGFIVGGDLTSSRCSFTPPFKSATNLVIADRSECIDRKSCLSVQLSAGDIRNSLNLVDNPYNLGRRVRIRGNIVQSYYGIPGLQGIKEFKWN